MGYPPSPEELPGVQDVHDALQPNKIGAAPVDVPMNWLIQQNPSCLTTISRVEITFVKSTGTVTANNSFQQRILFSI